MKFEISNSRAERGIALILVLLALFVLSVLAAAMVFTARSEVFSSRNYRLEAQAEYVAHAGVQRAVNFFNDQSATGYAPLNPVSVGTSCTPSPCYSLTNYTNNPVSLYFSTTAPVRCLAGCTGGAAQVKLGSSGNVYPPPSATSTTDVITNWKNSLTSQTISDGLGGYGTYDVTASLLEWHTVNNALLGVPASGCGDPSANAGVCRAAYEVWQVTSTGSWTGGVSPASGGKAMATVQIQAVIAPMYVPYFGNALYGLCNVTMSGSPCTDSYNSAGGSYTCTPLPGCLGGCATPGAGGSNATATGAGIGSNGGITLSGTPKVGGNVGFADAATNPACNTGFSGSTTGVAGSVLPGPSVPAPPAPDMTAWGYSFTSTSPGPGYVNTSASLHDLKPPKAGGGNSFEILNAYLYTSPAPVAPPGGAAILATGGTFCPAVTGSTTGFLEYYTVNCPSGVGGCQGLGSITYGSYNCIALTTTNNDGSGTSSSPFTFKAISTNQSGTPVVNLITTNGVSSPSFVAGNIVDTGNGGYINVTGQPPPTPSTAGATAWLAPYAPVNVSSALVLDVGTTASIGGQGMMNYNSSSPGVPSPDYLKMNILGTGSGCTSAVLTMTGQAALSAMITVPNGNAVLAGSGSGGVFFGSILASQVCDKGGYAVHYDSNLNSESGMMYSPKLMTITRPMY